MNATKALILATALIPNLALANEDRSSQLIENLLKDVQMSLSDSITVTPLESIVEQDSMKSSPSNLLNFSINNQPSNTLNETESLVEDNKDIEEYGYNSEYAEKSIGIEINAVSESMRSARIYSIDEATKYAVNEFLSSINQEFNSDAAEKIRRNHIERVLIIDEEYNSKTGEYIGYFDVWIATDKAQKILLGFDNSEDFANLVGPEWVLIVPSKIDDLGYWQLSEKNDKWTDAWKIPTNENNTQFVATTGDADDRKASLTITTMSEFAEFFSNKYNAPAVLFTSFNQENGLVTTLFWDKETGFITQKNAPIVNNKDSITAAKEASLSLFWNTLAQEGNTNEYSDTNNEEDLVSDNIYKYLVVGNPKYTESGVMINLQIIIPEGMTWNDIEYNFRSKNKFNMVSVEQGRNSVLVRAYLEGLQSKESIDYFLHSIGLKPY